MPDQQTPAAADSDRGFWTKRLYAAAAVVFLLRAPAIAPPPTLAGTLGRYFGAIVGALLVVALAKKGYLLFRGWRQGGAASSARQG
jgi:hypothetical protein